MQFISHNVIQCKTDLKNNLYSQTFFWVEFKVDKNIVNIKWDNCFYPVSYCSETQRPEFNANQLLKFSKE